MSGSFGSLEMGKSALNAFRLGMQTVGHNISNMNTEGYTRQRVNFRTVTPENIANVGQLGQGMYADDIVRLRDEFLDFQYRDNMADVGYWDKINDLYRTTYQSPVHQAYVLLWIRFSRICRPYSRVLKM